jgi:hypothetical protein
MVIKQQQQQQKEEGIKHKDQHQPTQKLLLFFQEREPKQERSGVGVCASVCWERETFILL